MADKITTLHPENDTSINLYPNVKEENIPNTIARVSYVDAGDNENDLAISAVRTDLDTEIADRKKDSSDTNGRVDGLSTDISNLEGRVYTLEQKPACLPLTGGTLNGGLDVMGRLAVTGKDGQDPMLEVGEGVADSHLSIQANKNLYSRVFTPTSSPYTFVEAMRDGVFEWTIESQSNGETKTVSYRLPYGANMPTGNHILALHDEVTLLSKQLETQRLEILDLKESTSQGLNEYEDTASFTENLTPIPNLLNDRKVVHGVRSILSSLDGDTKKITAGGEPPLIGFEPKSVKMIGREYSKDFVVGEKVRYISVPADFQQEWSDIVLNSPTYGNARFRPNTTGSALWNLVDSVSGSIVYQSDQNLYGKDAIAVLPEEMTFSKWFNETRKWGDGTIKNVVGQDLIPTSLLNVTLNKVGTAKDQLIVYQQENGLFGVKHRKEVGIKDLANLPWVKEDSSTNLPSGHSFCVKVENFQVVQNLLTTIESQNISSLSDANTQGILYYGLSYYSLIYADENISTVQELVASFGEKVMLYALATPTETTIATDLSLSQVSALQNAGYLVEIEAETMKYGVRGSANLTMLTKGE